MIGKTQPFDSCLAFDYFDGPTEGIAMREEGPSHYFKMVAWDHGHDLRIFAGTEIESSVTRELWAAFAAIEEPRLPIWVPSWGDADEASILIDRVRETITSHRTWSLYEAWQLTDGDVRSVTLSQLQVARLVAHLQTGDWLRLSSPSTLEAVLDALSHP